jgi:hypothetical protein
VRNKNNLRFLVTLLFAAVAFAALVFADLGALAQNANTSPTGDASAENANANMSGARRRGRRRGRRRATAATNAADATANEAAVTGEAQTNDVSGEQADLSGTYTGHVMMSGGHDMDGDGTLTITGNTFQLESAGMTHGGRVYAVTTRGYIGAAFYFTDLTNSATNTPVVANVRARKSGDRLWLSPVPNTQTKMMFGTGGGGGRGRRGRRGRRSDMTTTTTSPAEATGDASTGQGMGSGDGTTTAAPRRSRGRRRGRRRATMNPNTNTNTNANTGDNSNATPPM